MTTSSSPDAAVRRRQPIYALSAGSQLDFLVTHGAVQYDAVSGTYQIDGERIRSAVEKMATRVLTLQGDGDDAGVVSWYRATTASNIRPHIDRIQAEAIPIKVIYEQGLEVLGLT